MSKHSYLGLTHLTQSITILLVIFLVRPAVVLTRYSTSYYKRSHSKMLRKYVGRLTRQKKGNKLTKIDTSQAHSLLLMGQNHDRTYGSPSKTSIDLNESNDRGESSVGALQLQAIQCQAYHLDKWGLPIGLIPLCVLLLSPPFVSC